MPAMSAIRSGSEDIDGKAKQGDNYFAGTHVCAAGGIRGMGVTRIPERVFSVCFVTAKQFTLECYKLTKLLPAEERFNMTQQIRRAALSVCLNIAEGASRKSLAERKRYYEVARGSIIEIDAALDISTELQYCRKENMQSLGEFMQRTFGMLSKMIC